MEHLKIADECHARVGGTLAARVLLQIECEQCLLAMLVFFFAGGGGGRVRHAE